MKIRLLTLGIETQKGISKNTSFQFCGVKYVTVIKIKKAANFPQMRADAAY